jgi:RNA-binding protein NOB1
VGDTD